MFIKTGNLFLYHLFEYESPTLCKLQIPRTSYHFLNCVSSINTHSIKGESGNYYNMVG